MDLSDGRFGPQARRNAYHVTRSPATTSSSRVQVLPPTPRHANFGARHQDSTLEASPRVLVQCLVQC